MLHSPGYVAIFSQIYQNVTGRFETFAYGMVGRHVISCQNLLSLKFLVLLSSMHLTKQRQRSSRKKIPWPK